MKKISTLLASLILTISVFAEAKPKSTLMIRSDDRGDVKVVVDGRRFEPNDNSLSIRGIETGSHQVKIYRERNTGLFAIFGKKYEVVFNGSISVKPFTTVMISIDRYGRSTITNSRKTGRYDRNDRDFGGHDFDFGRNGKYGDFDDDRDGHWGDYDQHDGYAAGMNDREFRQVMDAIGREWLESNKLKSATQIVRTNSLTTAQVKQMLLLFNIESNKLTLAKQAYANTVDKRNYFMINDVFAFSSSKDDLARFIRNSH